MIGIYGVCRWDGFMWHDILFKFHENWDRRSSNIKGFASAIWEAVMLVLPMEGNYKVRRWNGLRWHDICTMFHDDRFRHLSNITDFTATIWEAQYWYYWSKRIMKHAAEMASCGMIYIVSLMKIGTVDQAILRFCLIHLIGWNTGIIDGRDLWVTPLRWILVPR
jgi:hypothetical protein